MQIAFRFLSGGASGCQNWVIWGRNGLIPNVIADWLRIEIQNFDRDTTANCRME